MKNFGSRTYLKPTPIPKMPPGLIELMEGLTKEVLKENPTDLYEFCATYMEKLLEIRDGPVQEVLPLKIKKYKSKKINSIKPIKNFDIKTEEKMVELLVDEKVFQKDMDTTFPRDIDLTRSSEIHIQTVTNSKSTTELFEVIEKDNLLLDYDQSNVENIEIHNKLLLDSGFENKDKYSFDGKKVNDTSEEAIPLIEIVSSIEEKTDINDNNQSASIDVTDHTEKGEMKINKLQEGMTDNDTTQIIENTDDFLLSNNKVTSLDIASKEPVSISLNKSELKIMTEKSSEIDGIESSIDSEKDSKEKFEELKVSAQEINLKLNKNILTEELPNTQTDSEIRLPESKVLKDVVNTKPLEHNQPLKDNNDLKKSDIDCLKSSPSKDITINVKIVEEGESLARNRLEEVYNDIKDLSLQSQTIKEIKDDDQCLKKEKEMANETSKILEKDIEQRSESLYYVTNINHSNTTDTSTMDLETAAITIQKVFRSFLFKSRGSTFDDSGTDEIQSNNTETGGYNNKERRERSLGITRMDSILQTVNEEKSLSLSTDDSSTLSSAATIIQSHVRGFLVRNKINSSKTLPTNSLINSDNQPVNSLDNEEDKHKNKTVLNIHIVPEAENRLLSRDESDIISMDLSLDGSPPTSINLHPLGYDKSEPRKQLKREDAFQSVSPPSNNSGKLSEDVDSVREIAVVNNSTKQSTNDIEASKTSLVLDMDIKHAEALVESDSIIPMSNIQQQQEIQTNGESSVKISSDESDVITPYEEKILDGSMDFYIPSKLMHSGEFHDVVVPTKVTRSDTSVVREFKSVLVYFLLWSK